VLPFMIRTDVLDEHVQVVQSGFIIAMIETGAGKCASATKIQLVAIIRSAAAQKGLLVSVDQHDKIRGAQREW
jgi:hypothetical protein